MRSGSSALLALESEWLVCALRVALRTLLDREFKRLVGPGEDVLGWEARARRIFGRQRQLHRLKEALLDLEVLLLELGPALCVFWGLGL